MKKSIVIITLCILQAACSSHRPAASPGPTLLSFEQLGAEISVVHEVLGEATEAPASVAAGR